MDPIKMEKLKQQMAQQSALGGDSPDTSLWQTIGKLFKNKQSQPQQAPAMPIQGAEVQPTMQQPASSNAIATKIAQLDIGDSDAMDFNDTIKGAGGYIGEQKINNTDDKSKGNFKDIIGKILPLVFRFGLPTAAGAALGAGNPHMNAGTGALMGLTGGGLGYLNDQGQKSKQGLESKRLDAYMQGSQGKLDLQKMTAEELADYRDQMAAIAKQNADTNAAKTAADIGSKTDKPTKEDATLTFLAKQFKGKPVSDADAEVFAANLATQLDPKDLVGDPGLIDTVKSKFTGKTASPEVIKQYMEAYNQFIKRGGAGTPTTKSGLTYTIEY